VPPGPGWWDCSGAGTIDSSFSHVREGEGGERGKDAHQEGEFVIGKR
jgi:hypothetical protein